MFLSPDKFVKALEEKNLPLLLAVFNRADPNITTLEQAEICMHRVRVQAPNVTFKARAYSHAWLVERGYPSELPDNLRPTAERLYPRVVEGVGISVNAKGEWLRPAAIAIRKAMEEAVSDLYANGDGSNLELINLRMYEARKREERKLFGRWPTETK